MISRPRLKPFLSVFPVDDRTWAIRGGAEELWRLQFTNDKAISLFAALLPYLTGQHDVETIQAQLSEKGFEIGAVEAALSTLEARSFLEESDASLLSPEQRERFRSQIAFLARFTNQGGVRYQSLLLESTILLIGSGLLSRALERQCRESGIGCLVDESGGAALGAKAGTADAVSAISAFEAWSHSNARPTCAILAEETYLPELCERLDEISRHHRLPWMLVRASDPHEGWVGPLFIPGETASYRSMVARLKGNVRHYAEYEAFEKHVANGGAPPIGHPQSFLEILAGIAVVELVKFITGIGVPTLGGRFVTINLTTWETEVHHVLRVPGIDTVHIHDRPEPFAWKDLVYGTADIERRRA